MPAPTTKAEQKEQQFYDALRDLFVGAKVEGDSGYINLMRIKSRYFTNGVEPRLKADIDTALEDFPEFREELFDKLYTFFKRYFSESGAIYFTSTPYQEKVYEQIYTNDRDVVLFWKTHMLYYVKTDRIFHSMPVEVDGHTFCFDVSGTELKRANEKRETIYDFREVDGQGRIVLDVAYSERGRKTKTDAILKAIHKAGIKVKEESFQRACRVFEKQAEVDYFINKNARAFLQEQLELWLYQYMFREQNVWTETRIRQLQTLKAIAEKVIAFIAQFEDELVRIWNKPKFTLNSHYVLTLDKLLALPDGADLWAQVQAHDGFAAQQAEWRSLGMTGDDFNPALVTQTGTTGDPLYPRWRYLPLDTGHFPDLEAEIIAQFDHLDQQLDGWLIHSENYQALNTLLPKFRERVQCVYIDPPYNTDASPIIYVNSYKDSSWLCLIENRVELTFNLMKTDGILCFAIDDEELALSRVLLGKVFPNQLGFTVVRSNPQSRKKRGKFSPSHEYALFYGKSEQAVPGSLELTKKRKSRYPLEDEKGKYAWLNFVRTGSNDKRSDRPKLYYPIYVDEQDNIRVPDMVWSDNEEAYTILEAPKENENVVYPIDDSAGKIIEKRWHRGHPRVNSESDEFRVRRDKQGKISIDFKTRMDTDSPPTTWWDDNRYASANYGAAEFKALFGNKLFDFPKAIKLVEDCLRASRLDETSIALDYFAGSGTTAHAVMNLNRADGGQRKYILVEMGAHFHDVILPRIKKVAFSSEWKDGKAKESGQGMSHFVKYFALEQYEDALRRVRLGYADADLFDNPLSDPYHSYVFLRDLKMLDSLDIDLEKDDARFDPDKVYPGIDLAETLSHLRGQWIRRLTRETVEFENGETINLQNVDWRLVKPLIWWGETA